MPTSKARSYESPREMSLGRVLANNWKNMSLSFSLPGILRMKPGWLATEGQGDYKVPEDRVSHLHAWHLVSTWPGILCTRIFLLLPLPAPARRQLPMSLIYRLLGLNREPLINAPSESLGRIS